MSMALLEIAKLATVSSLTTAACYLYQGHFMKTSAPAPGVARVVLGGTISAAKGAVSVPYVKEALISVASIAAVVAVMRVRRVRKCVEDSVWGLKERMGVKLREQASTSAREIIPESIRADSSETAAAMPKVQVKIGQKRDGVFIVYGSAVRIADAMVVPEHVLVAAKDEDDCVYAKGSQGSIRISVKGFDIIETDLSARSLTPEEFSKIGMPQVRLAENLPLSGEFVSVCGVSDAGTVGKLVHDRTTFGKVCYSGTTMPGYSGAPYMKGGSVIGIHCWGGKTNGGYSASYVKVLVKRMAKQTYETSEGWLLEQFAKNIIPREDIRFDPGNDEAWLRHNGSYHIVTGTAFRKAKGLDYIGWDDADSMRIDEAFRHSGESKSLKNPGASGDVNQPGVLDQAAIKALMFQLTSYMKKQAKLTKDTPVSSQPGTSTTGLLSVPKQN
uniref:Serine protease n=1 Tax=Riboviria sp. TaxID=2585031 RepID=A0A8K1JFW8_9VIRU|nr:MAG: hypothetical protein 1 [Riboviria sp.]